MWQAYKESWGEYTVIGFFVLLFLAACVGGIHDGCTHRFKTPVDNKDLEAITKCAIAVAKRGDDRLYKKLLDYLEDDMLSEYEYSELTHLLYQVNKDTLINRAKNGI